MLIATPLWADVSEKQRLELSDQMMADIAKEYGNPEELPGNAPISRIFNNLVQHAHRKGINYRMKVAENKQINAYAMPDGRVVFLSGLIKALPSDDDAPLAWVAAHEISHIELRHAEKNLTSSLTSGIIIYLLVGKSSGLVQALGAISQGLLVSGYSRVNEYEADRHALVLMREAGYDPSGALVTLRLFQDLDKKRRGLRIFPTHPRPAERCKSVMAWMQSNGLAVNDQSAGEVKVAQPKSPDRIAETGGKEGSPTESQAPAAIPPAATPPANNDFVDLTLEKPQPLVVPRVPGSNSDTKK